MLTLELRHRLGSLRLEARLRAAPRSVTVLVGESGGGKSTLLRLVAGLLAPDAGRIVAGDVVWSDTAARRFVPPEARSVGYVAQDYALFPHLSAARNVAFGLSAMGLPRHEVRARTTRALGRFGLADLAGRRPRELSGGQQQRVALARALVLEPEVLLLDEPLSALDPNTRRAVRGELRRTLAELPCVTLLVTHHPAEALAFGEQIAVLEAGRVSQCGSRDEFVRHPGSAYVAEFLGINLFHGEIVARPGDGEAMVAVEGTTLAVPDPGHGGSVRLVVHPHDVVVSVDPPAGSARNVLRGRIEELLPEPPAGERVRVLVATRPPLAAQVTRRSADSLGLGPGVEVYASFKATGVGVQPA